MSTKDLSPAYEITTPKTRPDPDEYVLDPSLTQHETLNSAAKKNGNPLTAFAQHILAETQGDAENLLAFNASEESNLLRGEPGFDQLLEQARKEEGFMMDDDGNVGETQVVMVDGEGLDQIDGDGELAQEVVEEVIAAAGARAGRKRRREVDGGEGTLDPAKMKRDSHKEVERRRRININDGITQISQLIPGGSDNIGKSETLKRAVQYLLDVNTRVTKFDEELAKRDAEKADIQTELDHTRTRLADEHSRSIRYETSWRDADDRAAASGFELERVKQELNALKASLGQMD